MPESIIEFIKTYSYLAIFILIYGQEIGLPVPFPNELILLFAGYLVFRGTLALKLLLFTAIGADFLGTMTLYGVFYFFGSYLIGRKPKWFPLSLEKIQVLKEKVSGAGWAVIFLLRITPFVRGYTSLVCGLLRLKPKHFLPIAFGSCGMVCSTFILVGSWAGPHWQRVAADVAKSKFFMLYGFIAVAGFYSIRAILRHYKSVKKNAEKAIYEADGIIRLHMVSETAWVTQGQGVHTAFIESLELLREDKDLIVYVNGEGRGNIFHSHTYGPYYFWKGLRYKGRRILTAHVIPDSSRGTIPFWRQMLPLTRWYLKLGYSFADVVIAISPTVESEIQKLGIKSKIIRIYNPVLLDNWRRTPENREKARKKLGIKNKERLVLGVGQLQERKGVEDFIDIAAALPETKFLWVGGRPWGVFTEGIQRIDKKIENATPNVFFAGLRDLKDMPAMYAAADIFLFPSYQENCPLAPLEAAASGLPVVYRDIPEYQSLYRSDYLKAGNTSAFIGMTTKLLADQKFYDHGVELSARLIREFDKSTIRNELLQLYRDTLHYYFNNKDI